MTWSAWTAISTTAMSPAAAWLSSDVREQAHRCPERRRPQATSMQASHARSRRRRCRRPAAAPTARGSRAERRAEISAECSPPRRRAGPPITMPVPTAARSHASGSSRRSRHETAGVATTNPKRRSERGDEPTNRNHRPRIAPADGPPSPTTAVPGRQSAPPAGGWRRHADAERERPGRQMAVDRRDGPPGDGVDARGQGLQRHRQLQRVGLRRPSMARCSRLAARVEHLDGRELRVRPLAERDRHDSRRRREICARARIRRLR